VFYNRRRIKVDIFVIIPIARMNSDMIDILRVIEIQVDDELSQLCYISRLRLVRTAGPGESDGWFNIAGHKSSGPFKVCQLYTRSRIQQ
jgi:hypothetical protein